MYSINTFQLFRHTFSIRQSWLCVCVSVCVQVGGRPLVVCVMFYFALKKCSQYCMVTWGEAAMLLLSQYCRPAVGVITYTAVLQQDKDTEGLVPIPPQSDRQRPSSNSSMSNTLDRSFACGVELCLCRLWGVLTLLLTLVTVLSDPQGRVLSRG